VVLATLGLSLAYYKVERLGLPLNPGSDAPVWTVEARVAFKAGGAAVKAELALPKNPPGFLVLDEDFISGNFGLATESDGPNRKAKWAVRRASGSKVLYYRLTLYEDDDANAERRGPKPAFPARPDYPELKRSAIEAVLDQVRSESADIATFTQELLLRLNSDDTDENIELLRDVAPSPAEWATQAVEILAGARIPARLIWGLRLREGLRHGELEPMLEVHNSRQWLAFDPHTGRPGFPNKFLVWRVGNAPLVRLSGGTGIKAEFSALSRVSDLVSVAQQRGRVMGSRVMEFSLFSLPVATQNIYRILLTVPLGAALLVLLRNVVGLQTFGTFMPILIALAFRETKLAWGVALFTILVSLGLLIRSYLATLKLLLVPRMASVVIIVILLMTLISIISHKLGLEQGLSIALFPMVVLAMTIERMSIVWEEHGPSDAIFQGLGSLAVACLAYLVMQNRMLQYLVFVFPELLLVLLAMTLLLGRYKGYRLTELWRFRAALAGPGDAAT
jgi:hypothetical protein